MKRAIFGIFVVLAAAAFAERSLTPGIEAFNACVPAESENGVAFSPFAFELDCCMFAEALDPVGRANVSEKLAVMSDFAAAYDPVIDTLQAMPPTNRIFFSSARTIGVMDIPKVNAEFKRRLFQMRTNASISRLWPARGAERWFQAMLDGWMEDFVMPVGKIGNEEYTVVDATVVAAQTLDNADATTSDAKFKKSSGGDVKIPFLKFRAKADFVRDAEKVVVRIPLRGDAFLYVLMPRGKTTLADVRRSITGETIIMRTLEPLDATQKGYGSGVCEVSIPKLDTFTTTETENGFAALKIQAKEILYLYPALLHRTAYQVVRFILDAGEVPEKPDVLPAATEKLTFDRPFVFFVYHPGKNFIPVVGQFTGE